MTLTYTETLLALTLVLLMAATLRAIYLAGTVSSLEQKLSSSQEYFETISAENEKLRQVEKRFQSFQADLNQAELTTRMQHSRMDAGRSTQTTRTPERYRYVHSLASRGIGSADIASILAISPREADQLVALAQLSNH